MSAGDSNSPVFDFTSVDFQSMEADLIKYAQARFSSVLGPEAWTDFNPSNEGSRIIELFAYASDLLSYMGNAQVAESIIATVVKESNFRKLAKPFLFEMKSAAAAKTTLRFTVTGAGISVPSSFMVQDASSTIFQPDVTGTSAGVTYDVTATQGRQYSVEPVATSNGTDDQAYSLANKPLIDGTLILNVNGVPWLRVLDLAPYGPNDQVFLLTVSEDDVATVTFGDGINGSVPPNGQQITATYKVGGGVAGNLPIGAISLLVSSQVGIVSVTNISAAEDGGPRQTLADARAQLPALIKANERAVTAGDYAALAVQLVTGVLAANALNGNPAPGGNPVLLYVVPSGGGNLTPSLSAAIVSAFRNGVGNDPGRGMMGKRVIPRTAVYVQLAITADAFVLPGSSAKGTAKKVDNAYTVGYGLGAVTFGAALDTQAAYNVVDPKEQNITGLARVFLREFTILPYFARYPNKATSGNGTVEGIAITSTTVQRREWSIRIVQAAPGFTVPQFQVVERRPGTVSRLSTSVVEDDSIGLGINELLGTPQQWVFHPREQESDETFTILQNSQTSVTVALPSTQNQVADLLLLAQPGDTFVVERPLGNLATSAGLGSIVRAVGTPAGNAGQPTITGLTNTDGFAVNDYVLLRDPLYGSQICQIQSKTATTLTMTAALLFAVSGTSTLDWFWYEPNKTVGFAVIQGSSVWYVGDTFYVDTYPNIGDLKLRPENYPLLSAENLNVNPVGGVR